MNEPRVVESVTNECQSLGRAHESSSARAEQLIACLEGEIAKRDEELAACRVSVENCEAFRARIAELEARIVWLECEAQVNAAPVSEAKAQGVVMPERKTKADYGVYIDEFADEAAAIYNSALDEVARLNAAPVQQVSVPEGWMLVPVEPTHEMLGAALMNQVECLDAIEVIRTDYKAMLAAALRQEVSDD